MPNAPRKRVLKSLVLPLEEAILEDAFVQPELRKLFEELRYRATVLAQTFTSFGAINAVS
jgi:hypothetical protein